MRVMVSSRLSRLRYPTSMQIAKGEGARIIGGVTTAYVEHLINVDILNTELAR